MNTLEILPFLVLCQFLVLAQRLPTHVKFVKESSNLPDGFA
jgi:hypothetical protein